MSQHETTTSRPDNIARLMGNAYVIVAGLELALEELDPKSRTYEIDRADISNERREIVERLLETLTRWADWP